ncbi:MAG: type VI secretion system tube protein TssD [Ferruginibacter sp.]|nr:hypothetical protein [Bacteroidota bacterium]MBX2919922.1 hypothetical protein [Ferruginibacter sp.]MCB0710356.1 hypothetical protein [Chitinophagaceae bacterium]MCC7379564.1 hypothetical protein [Chitinophagaceae bacterium]
MSFQARLIIDDDTFTVLSAEYALSVPYDVHNRPTGRIRGGIIDLTFESGSANSYLILQWIMNRMTKEGRIEFSRRDTGSSTQKVVRFRDAYCVYMKDIFVSNGASPMITKITISAHTIDIDNEVLHNSWPGIESSESDSDSSSSSGSSSPHDIQTNNSLIFD